MWLCSLGMASSVLKVDVKRARVAVSHPDGSKWQVGQSVAIESDDKNIAWGIVTKVTARGAIVLIKKRTEKALLAGQRVIESELPLDTPTKKPKRKTRDKEEGIHPRIVLSRPHFRALFDLLLSYRPKEIPSVTFENSHSFLVLQIAPSETIEFGFEVSTSPRYFELDYEAAPGVELRVGKIWVPFDDDEAHKFYGGRPNLNRFLQPTGTAFLPDVWADYGAGLRFSLLSTGGTEVSAHLYAVNGFGELSSGDPNPSLTQRAEAYPDFGSIATQDNNDDKAAGGRLSMSVRDVFDFGASVYRGKYTNRGKSQAAVTLFGVDGRLRLGSLELRGGNLFAEVELLGAKNSNGDAVSSFKRGGYYAEIGLWFSPSVKFAVRGGVSQNDSRFLATSDQTIAAAILSYRAQSLLVSLEYSKDFEVRDGKTNTDYAALRLATYF